MREHCLSERRKEPNHSLQLLINDPWFAWLSLLSQLIVSIDEAEDAEELLTQRGVDALVKQSAQLLVASETDEGFTRHYFEALQHGRDLVLVFGATSIEPAQGEQGRPRPVDSGNRKIPQRRWQRVY